MADFKYDTQAISMVQQYADAMGGAYREMIGILNNAYEKLNALSDNVKKLEGEVQTVKDNLQALNSQMLSVSDNATKEEKDAVAEHNRQIQEQINTAQTLLTNAIAELQKVRAEMEAAKKKAEQFKTQVEQFNKALIAAHNQTSNDVKNIKKVTLGDKTFEININAGASAYKHVTSNKDVQKASEDSGYSLENIANSYIITYERDGEEAAIAAVEAFVENVKTDSQYKQGETYDVITNAKLTDMTPVQYALYHLNNDPETTATLSLLGGSGLDFINSICSIWHSEKLGWASAANSWQKLKKCPKSMANYQTSYKKLTKEEKEKYKLNENVDDEYDTQLKKVTKNGYTFYTVEVEPKGLTWLERQFYHIDYQHSMDSLDSDPKVYLLALSKSGGIVYTNQDALREDSKPDGSNWAGFYSPDNGVIVIKEPKQRGVLEHEIGHLIDDMLKKDGFYSENDELWQQASKEHLAKLNECGIVNYTGKEENYGPIEYFASFAASYAKATETERNNIKTELKDDYEAFEKLLLEFEGKYGKKSESGGKSKKKKDEETIVYYDEGYNYGDGQSTNSDEVKIRELSDMYFDDIMSGTFDFFDEEGNQISASEFWDKLYNDSLEKLKQLNYLGFEEFTDKKDFFSDMMVAYFQKADELKREFPDIYNEFTRLFGEDVGGRFTYFMSE